MSSEQLAVKTKTAKQWHLLHSYRSRTDGRTFFLTYCGNQFLTILNDRQYIWNPETRTGFWRETPGETNKIYLSRDRKITCGYCVGVIDGLRGTIDITGDIEPSAIK